MCKPKAVPVNKDTHDKLNDIVEKRQPDSFNLVTKKGVVAELIDKAHRKEIKK